MARRRQLADGQVTVQDRRIVHDWRKAHNGTKLSCRVKKERKRIEKERGWKFKSGVTSAILRVDASARVE